MFKIRLLAFLPLRHQFVLMMTVLAAVIIFMYSTLTYLNEKAEYIEESASELKTISRVLEHDYSALLLMGLPSDSIELLRKLKSFPMFDHVELEDSLGKSILHFSKNGREHIAFDIEEFNQIMVVGDLFFYKAKVIYQDEFIGTANYAISNDNYLALISELIELFLIITPIALGLSILLSVWLQSFFTRPLEELTNTINSIAEDESYDQRLEVYQGDKSELSVLARSFNALLTRINHTFDEIKKSNAYAQELAYYDELTGLPNRRLFTERMEYILDVSKREQRHGALLFIDLDNFKTLNDARGHAAGDELLKQVANSLKKAFRAEDTIARLGGDEFVILSGQLEDTEDSLVNQLHSLMLKLRYVLNDTFVVMDVEHHLTASIGITTFPKMADNPEELMKQADTAMYRAKDAGRDGYKFYQPEMQVLADARLKIESELHFAINQNELELFYQPQVDEFGRIVAAEALIRWFKADGSMISPADFIPIAEITGLILPIGHWVIREGFKQLKRWENAGVSPDFKLSINISPYQFHQDGFLDDIKDALAEIGVSPKSVTLEVTEGITIKDIQSTIDKMHVLVDMGFSISMDDFGTGYSSLTYLKKLPLSELKIDQSFVRDLHVDESDAEIAATIIAMAKNLKLDVVAEGVEEESQLRFLNRHGCQIFQGYYFHKPMRADALTELLLGNLVIL
ncbi:MAG: EAL domain-containing protein [Cycloclasticus sp.]|nr:EAL domain-containing protein [Cycloclasticus sp.]